MRIRSAYSTDRQHISKMNWKCFFVGLILVFPGTLLGVEGRYYNLDNRDAEDRDSYLSKLLFNLYKQERALEKYSLDQEDGGQTFQKKLDNSQQEPNNNPQKNNQVPEDDVPLPAEEAPSEPSDPGQERDDPLAVGSEVKTTNEVNHAVKGPVALAQSQEGGASRHGVEGPGGILSSNTAFAMIVAGCTVLAAVGIVGAGVCWYKYHKSAKAASVVDYPAYGVTGPTKDRAPSTGDRKLAHSAQMYHYQHQKQQMMALQSASSGEMKHDASDDESGEDNEDADYTVYECPGLAPTGEMEVKNPLFRGDDTPSTPANDDTHPPPPDY